MLSIRVVTPETPDHLDSLLHLFSTLFPEDVRYLGYIRQCVAEPITPLAIRHQWLIELGGEAVGFRLFNYMRRANVGFDRYVGIRAQFRQRGLGRALLQHTMAQLAADARAAGHTEPLGMLDELDPPAVAPTAQEQQRRLERAAIFRRLGAAPLDVAYVEPPMVNGAPVDDPALLAGMTLRPMMLWFTPFRAGWQPSPAQVHLFVRTLLVDNYRLSQNSPALRQVLASIPSSDAHALTEPTPFPAPEVP